jgi:Mn-containing catalase
MLTGASDGADGNGVLGDGLAGVKGARNAQQFIAGGQAALPQDSNGRPWNGDYVFSSGDLVEDLTHNFFLETGARNNKLKVYEMTAHPAARALTGYLLCRGGVHQIAYARAIEKLTGADLTKMFPTPRIPTEKIPECQPHIQRGEHKRLYRFSPSDYGEIVAVFNGPHPETGEELEVADQPPEGALDASGRRPPEGADRPGRERSLRARGVGQGEARLRRSAGGGQAWNAARRSASASTSARAAGGSLPNGFSVTPPLSYRQVPATAPSIVNGGWDCGFFVWNSFGRCSSGRICVRRQCTRSVASHVGRKRTGAGASAGGSGARGRSTSRSPCSVLKRRSSSRSSASATGRVGIPAQSAISRGAAGPNPLR